MNIIIPGELRGEGGVGDAFKGLGGAISKAGAVAKQAADNIQSQYDFNDYSELNQARAVEKEKATADFWVKEDGSTHEADGTPRDPMANYQALIKSIDDKYREKAGKINNRVADLLDKRGQIENYQYMMHGQKIQNQKLFDRTIKNTQNETDIAIQNTIRAGGDFTHLENQEALILSNQQYLDGEGISLGLNAGEFARTEMARGYEAAMKGILADPIYAPAFVKTMDAVPELKKKLFGKLPGEKWAEMEKLIVAHKDKMAGADAFQATLAEADQDPGVKAGKVDRLEAAQKLWMRPETITKYGITDLQWRSGMLNFEASLKYRDEQDEKHVGGATIELAKKYNQHRLTYDDIETTFQGVANPKLRAQFIEHWVKLLDTQAAQARANAAAERAADAAKSTKDPFNVDVPAIKARLLQKSIETPFAPGLANEVSLALGAGISSNTFEAIMKNIRAADIWKTPAGKEVYRAINTDRKNYLFSTNENENEARYGDLIEYYRDYLTKNPNAKPKEVLDDYLAQKTEMRKGWIRKQIDQHWGK